MLSIPKKFVDEMIRHALEDDPNECCGILAGTGNIVTRYYPIANAAPSPYRYVMDPGEQLQAMIEVDEDGVDLLAFYHSHTHSDAYPSNTDTRMAVESGWVDFCYVLVSLKDRTRPIIKAFFIDSSGKISEYAHKVT